MNPAYLEDASGFKGHADTVHIPTTAGEVVEVIRAANRDGSPLTIAGAGTGVTGGRVPLGGRVLSLEKFRRIEIGQGRAIAGAGVSLKDLQSAAAGERQFYAPDPTEWTASIGGTIANNASGSRSFLYGDTRRHVVALTVATMDGTVRTFRRGETIPFEVAAIALPQTTKHSAGYRLQPGMDWVDLFVGSEGTLGAVLEAELKLSPAPGELLTGVIFFGSDEDALSAVEQWRRIAGLRMLEYLDANSLALIRSAHDTGRAGAALMIEQEIASDEDYEEWDRRLRAAKASEHSWIAASDQDRERFRRFRHAVPEAVNETVRRRGLLKMNTDFAVPVERNSEMMTIYRTRLEREFPAQYVIFGHIGDAHLHVNLLPESREQADRAQSLILEFARAAVSMGGTVGAEHGLGKRKAHLLELQYSTADLEAMKDVKRRLDPKWLLGQGTLFGMPR